MQVTYHIGMHCTDEDRALTCLVRNQQRLAAEGSAIARPGLFRPILRQAMIALKGEPAPPAMQRRLLQGALETAEPRHILFSSDSFLCVPQRAVARGCLYPQAEERVVWIRNLFPDAEAHFCLALRNPATFLPALHRRIKDGPDFETFADAVDPEGLRWSDMISRLVKAVPEARFTVWSNEDSPVIWPEILALLAGRPPGRSADDLEGWEAFLATLLPQPALERLMSYWHSHTPQDAVHGRRVLSAFLDRFAEADACEERFDLPDWDAPRLQHLTAAYEEDLLRIERMPEVDLRLA